MGNNSCVTIIQRFWRHRSGQRGDYRDASSSNRRVAHRHAVRKRGCHGGAIHPAMTMASGDNRDILWLTDPFLEL